MNDQSTEKQSWWQRLSGGLKRTSASIGGAVTDIVAKRRPHQAMLDDIEDVLIRADLGVESAARIASAVGEGRYDKSITADEVKAVVATEVEKVLTPVAKPLMIGERKPFVVLVVGVNGSGKTTTIGKLAAKFRAEGRSVMLAAGDTFRAAAIHQLNTWGGRRRGVGDRAPAGRGRCRPRFRRTHAGARRGRGRAARRYRRPPAEQGDIDGRAPKDRARDEEGRCGGAARRSVGARRHGRAECAVPGRGGSWHRRRHRSWPD